MQRQSVLHTQAAKGKEEETSVYQLYYDFRQPVPRLQGHQILAVNRGEREGFLKVTLETDREQALICVRRCVLVPGGGAAAFLRAACEDAYDRLIAPSMERELRAALTERANEGAIRNFALNLRPLLMQPPVRGHVTMASTQATATAARSPSLTRRARCWTPPSSTPHSPKQNAPKRSKRSGGSWIGMR